MHYGQTKELAEKILVSMCKGMGSNLSENMDRLDEQSRLCAIFAVRTAVYLETYLVQEMRGNSE